MGGLAYGSSDRDARLFFLRTQSRVTSGSGTGSRQVDSCSVLLDSWISPHSREAKFHATGLQSYSRGLCLSRGKHHMLYLQQ